MRSDEDYKERYGEKPSGVVCRSTQLTADDGCYLIKLPVNLNINTPQESNGRFTFLFIIAHFFKALFKSNFRLNDINQVYLFAEIPKGKFSDEWQAAVDNSYGAFYGLSKDVVEGNTNLIPKIVHIASEEVSDEERDG